MPVTDCHPDYIKNIALINKCRLAIEGEDAVKQAGEVILPKLGGMDYHDYDAYKNRAMFYTAAYRTVKGLAGTIMRKPLTYKGLEEDDEILAQAGIDGESLNSLAGKACEETLGVQRVGFLIDAPEGSQTPYTATYLTENITNWRYKAIDGKKKLIMVTLKEEYEEWSDSDFFAAEKKVQYRVLKLMVSTANSEAVNIPAAIGETGLVYVQEVWREDPTDTVNDGWSVYSTTVPTMAGNRPIDTIPFVIITSDPTSLTIQKSPVLDLVNVNMSHYRTSADLEHGRHYTALPTPWAAGFDIPEGGKLRIGGSTAWIAQDPNAKASYLEFSGAGLASLEKAMVSKEKLMATLGARLLEQQTLDSEAAETVKLRHQGESSVLSTLAESVESGINQVLVWLMLWKSEGKEAIVSINKDFNVVSISPQMVVALMQSYQASAISWNTLFYNLKKGEIQEPNITAEEEMERISAGPTSLGGVPMPEANEIEDQTV